MKYMGSKAKHANEILKCVLKNRKPDQYYVEPFIGGANIIDKVQNPRMGNDINKYIIALLYQLQRGWLPPKHISEEEYNEMKHNQAYCSDALLGYIGFQLSFGALWFSSYRKDSEGKRDYSYEAFCNVQKQAEKLKGIQFFCGDYRTLFIPEKSIIYCDPPYDNCATYNKSEFDHDTFWEWCRQKINEGHEVFVSEYEAPEDFINLWKKSTCNSLGKDTGKKKGLEKLFIHESQVDNFYLGNFV